jgi:hypothetical protein
MGDDGWPCRRAARVRGLGSDIDASVITDHRQYQRADHHDRREGYGDDREDIALLRRRGSTCSVSSMK